MIDLNGAMTEARLRVGGMTCAHCQEKVEQALLRVSGAKKAGASFSKGTAWVRFDPAVAQEADFTRAIEAAGYSANGRPVRMTWARAAAVVVAISIAHLLIMRISGGALAGILPLAQAGMGYGMLFVIGLITSIHCVVMCGGISLSQCMAVAGREKAAGEKDSLRPSLLYNLGRVISYTAIGALVGAAGSVISFSGAMKGAVEVAAGVFMVIMGLNMTGLFPWLAGLVPRMPRSITRNLNQRKRNAGPIYVGLLNGLMPCGPLQAMQLYALSTGSPMEGALSMMVFSLGTVPLMFALGALSSMMSRKFTARAMAAGAVLVVALGLTMLTGGLNLAGVRLFAGGPATSASAVITASAEQNADQSARPKGVQKVRTTLESGRYSPITVTAGTPVEWTIDAPEGSINGCNNRMVIPAYGIEHAFTLGENVIRFTPDKAGTYPYSCWMGMITSTITVTEPVSGTDGVIVTTAKGAAGSAADAGAVDNGLTGTAGSCCGLGSASAKQAGDSGSTKASGSCCGGAITGTQAPEPTQTPDSPPSCCG